MIGELQDQKADLVVADITITYEREQGKTYKIEFERNPLSVQVLTLPCHS